MGQEAEDCAAKRGWYEIIEDSWYTAASFNSNKNYILWTKKETQFQDGNAVWRRATEVKLQASKLKGLFVNWFKDSHPHFTPYNLPSGVSDKDILEQFRRFLFQKSQEKIVNLSADEDVTCPAEYLPDGK